VDGLDAVGDIVTKISTNCVINLYAALLFTCLFYGLIICVVITVWKFGYFLYMLHVYVYCYYHVNSCQYILYLSIMFYI
jgi:hypothetical protein